MILKSIISLISVCLLSVCAITHVQAATILGTGSLYSTDDLSIIQTGSGEVQEWLDIPVTMGMTTSTASATYAEDGFRVASSAEVSELFSAFSLPTFAPPINDVFTSLGITASDSDMFRAYFGETDTNATLALFDNPNDIIAGYATYTCLGSGCGGDGFVFSQSIFTQDNVVGVFLVRTVPIPAAVWLFGSGLIGLIGVARRKKS